MLVQVSTPYEREVVCMAASDSLLAVGSQNHVSLVDSRVKACVSSFANAEHNHGEKTIFILSAYTSCKTPVPLQSHEKEQ